MWAMPYCQGQQWVGAFLPADLGLSLGSWWARCWVDVPSLWFSNLPRPAWKRPSSSLLWMTGPISLPFPPRPVPRQAPGRSWSCHTNTRTATSCENISLRVWIGCFSIGTTGEFEELLSAGIQLQVRSWIQLQVSMWYRSPISDLWKF